jgi:ABC-type antimicrobial peptide transport system permease subunit
VGWKFIEGRDFSPDFPSDTTAVILNETAVKYMRLKNPVGETISSEFSPRVWKIIGVVQDMIMQSPYEPVKPTLFFLDDSDGSYMHIRIKPTLGAAEALAKIEAVIKKLVPSALFDYKFVDQEYDQKFASEKRVGILSGFFAVLAIFISGLGLFGLASFVAEQRTKEIGIRKVIGASIFSLWRMLSKDFVILVLISCAVSIPVAYYYMNGWLQKYQYHTEIGWSVFVMATGAAVLITLLTVSFQAIKAAMASPVKSLRSE